MRAREIRLNSGQKFCCYDIRSPKLMNSCPLCSKIFCFTKERTLYFGRLTWSSFFAKFRNSSFRSYSLFACLIVREIEKSQRKKESWPELREGMPICNRKRIFFILKVSPFFKVYFSSSRS